MNRWVNFSICLFMGVILLFAGWTIPAHLRAVEAGVLDRAGQKTPSLVDRGLELVQKKKTGSTELLAQAAEQQQISGHEKLRSAVENSFKSHPKWQALG